MEEIKYKSMTVYDPLVKHSTATSERIPNLSQSFNWDAFVWYMSARNLSVALQYHKDIDILELIQQKATKTTMGLKHMMHKERLRELGYLNLKKGKPYCFLHLSNGKV